MGELEAGHFCQVSMDFHKVHFKGTMSAFDQVHLPITQNQRAIWAPWQGELHMHLKMELRSGSGNIVNQPSYETINLEVYNISRKVRTYFSTQLYVCPCGPMCSTLAWTRLIHWVTCSRPACVKVGRHIASGAAHWLPWEPSNIPRKISEIITISLQSSPHSWLATRLSTWHYQNVIWNYTFTDCKGQQRGFKCWKSHNTRIRVYNMMTTYNTDEPLKYNILWWTKTMWRVLLFVCSN